MARVRFAISPLTEAYSSLRALDEPASQAHHRPWISRIPTLIAEDDLALLCALQPRDSYSPDFIHPPPRSPSARLEDELADVLRTPADRIRAEVEYTYRKRPLPDVLQRFVVEPDAAAAHLVDVIRRYWRLVIGPHWDRLRAVLEGDILYRARQVVDGGVHQLLADIHPDAKFVGDSLMIEKPREIDRTLDGQGLLLVPSAFGWPSLRAIFEPPWQPTLVYPARGIATLWEPERPGAAPALDALLGSRRALVLTELDAPRSTTELAHRLGLSTPSVSQHLGVLRAAGLVKGGRVGRVVLYARTGRGDGLVRGVT